MPGPGVVEPRDWVHGLKTRARASAIIGATDVRFLGGAINASTSRWSVAPRAADLYEQLRVPALFAPMAEIFLAHVPLADGMQVLDVACGTGAVTRLAARKVAPRGRVAALDRSREMLAVAAQAVAAAPVPIEWVLGDAGALPFDGERFDVALCQQGLQFFDDPPAALREMGRVTARGGRVACLTFGAPSRFQAALAAAIHRHAGPSGIGWQPADQWKRSPDALQALAESAGLHRPTVISAWLSRTVLPTQEWLLNDVAASPFGEAVQAMNPLTRAQLVREVADALRDLWAGDAFSVPTELLILSSQKP